MSACGAQPSKAPGPLPDALRLSIVSGRLGFAVARSGLSRNEIAAASGVSPSALSRYVRGERLITTHALIALCPVLGISADWILGIEVPAVAIAKSAKDGRKVDHET